MLIPSSSFCWFCVFKVKILTLKLGFLNIQFLDTISLFFVCLLIYDMFSFLLACFAELIRSLHVYQVEDGKQNEIEREFLFSANGSYMEMTTNPALRLLKFRVSEVYEGLVNGLWLCILAFHADRPLHFTCIPSLLSISRYTIFC